jgi:hypothetical protein
VTRGGPARPAVFVDEGPRAADESGDEIGDSGGWIDMLNRTNRVSEAPGGRSTNAFYGDRARHAVDVALRCLRERDQNERVRALALRAETLRSEIEQWQTVPPSIEVREGAMQRALTIHLEAVALARKL